MQNFSYRIIIIAFMCILSSCSFLEDDGLTPIEKERLELEESVYSYKVLLWKYLKMTQKARYINEDVYPELLPVKEKLGNIEIITKMYDKKMKNDELSALDYIDFYKDFTEIKDYVKETDEDMLPSIFEFDESNNKKTIHPRRNKTTKVLRTLTVFSSFSTFKRFRKRDCTL